MDRLRSESDYSGSSTGVAEARRYVGKCILRQYLGSSVAIQNVRFGSILLTKGGHCKERRR